MRSEALLFYFTLLQIAGAGFPEDSEPLSISHGNYTKQYPAFVGHKPGRNNTQRHKLDIQLIMIMNNTLYIAARDHIYTVDTDTANSDEIFFSKKMTWKSRQVDVDTCRMKGKHKDECHNFIKVLLQQNDDTLFVCGTNAFNPACRTYKMDNLEALGEEISGMARCPYDAKHANIALFADGKLYSATVTDFLAIDAVIYRSLGDSLTLRTVKHDSKWLKEPYFVQAVNYGDFIYFFFREIAMEYNTMGKVVFPRVARVCKNDRGGSPRVLEKQWTSFLKSRLNCSIPGDSHFYFNILQAVTNVIHINRRDVVMATFSTPYNSFKEQKSPDSTWTPFPEEKVPRPRPGTCAGSASMERYKVSTEFPDDTLNFIKRHPLMDEAVPSIANRPWFLKTMVRYRFTRIAVDNEAGPHKNHTVVFLGSEKGIILKFLAKMNKGFLNDSLFLEELNVYNPDKCSIDGVKDKHIIGMQIDSKSHALWVAFTSCVVKVPLSRCERHGRCKKSCIASRDPYCGWVSEGACRQVVGNMKSAFEQDVEHGNTDGLGDCQNTFVALNDHLSSYEGPHLHHHHTLSLPTSALPEAAEGPLGRGRMVEQKDPPMISDKGEEPYVAVPSQTQPEGDGVIRESYQKGRDQLVPVTLLAIAVILAFAIGAIFSGIIVYCVCDHRQRDLDLTGRKEKDSHHHHSRRGSMNSVTKLTGLFETQAKDGRPEAILTPLMHNGRIPPNGKMLIKADQHHLNLTALPTPESTPMQPRHKPGRHSYKTVKSPCHNFNMVDPDGVLPPHVPQHEASLSISPAVPQMGKWLEVHSSVYDLRKGSASSASGSSGLKKHNTNSSNSSHLARHHSFNRVETPPPAPQRVDSIQMTAQGISLSQQPGMSPNSSLPRTGLKHLKPDVPPKPSVVSLSTKKSSDSCT
ncbi:semaphorin-6A-like [Cynoglossus semilaevis]|uniref:semaphorin-6A-like n=1 Tax=Cynoglossus semilaevis TaxID=244447 RepID=UPI000D626BE6|nr:semaphorin-6A-like [Cynoglossus semilaevis]